jgi:hypothetical protein
MKRIVLGAITLALASTVSAAAQATPTWHKLNSTCARVISASDGQTPWAIGCTNGSGGNYPILYTKPADYDISTGSNSWTLVNGGGSWLSAAYLSGVSEPYIWLVTSSGELFEGHQSTSTSVSWGSAVLPESSVYTVSVDPSEVTSYAYVAEYTNGTNGHAFSYYDVGLGSLESFGPGGAGQSFSVAPDVSDWWSVGNTNGPEYAYSSWNSITGCAAAIPGAIAGAPSGTAYAIGCDGDIHYWNGSSWSSTGFSTASGYDAVQVSVGSGTGNPVWAIDNSNSSVDGVIWTYQ